VIEISAATSDLATKAAALGFFGMLTLDDHHSFHHEMMARGFSAHKAVIIGRLLLALGKELRIEPEQTLMEHSL